MPQMAPYNWLILFMLFNLMMIFLMSYNHYMIMKFINPKKNTINKMNYLWIW